MVDFKKSNAGWEQSILLQLRKQSVKSFRIGKFGYSVLTREKAGQKKTQQDKLLKL